MTHGIPCHKFGGWESDTCQGHAKLTVSLIQIFPSASLPVCNISILSSVIFNVYLFYSLIHSCVQKKKLSQFTNRPCSRFLLLILGVSLLNSTEPKRWWWRNGRCWWNYFRRLRLRFSQRRRWLLPQVSRLQRLFSQIEVPFLLPSSSFLKPRFEFSNFHCSTSWLAHSYRSLLPIYETATWCQRFVLLNGHSFDWRIFLETLLYTFGWVIWCRAKQWLLCILKKERDGTLSELFSAVRLFWILWILNGLRSSHSLIS